MSEIIHFPKLEKPTAEQCDYFHMQAAYWDEVAEMATKQLEYAVTQREYALRMLGMLAIDGGMPE